MGLISLPQNLPETSPSLRRLRHCRDELPATDTGQPARSRLMQVGEKFLDKQAREMRLLRNWESDAADAPAATNVWILLNGDTAHRETTPTSASSPSAVASINL